MNSRIKIIGPLLLILSIAATIFFIPRLIFDDSLQSWVPPESQIINDYKTFLAEFKTDALMIVSIVNSKGADEDAFSNAVDSITKQIAGFQHVKSVGSWPPPFLKHKTKSPNNIHSFFISFLPPSHLNPNRPELVQDLTEFLDSANVEYHLAGTGVIHKAINDFTSHASRRYLLIGIALLIILLVVYLRDFQIILKTVGISLGSVSLVLLAAYLLGIQFNMIMSILPCLILFYSTSISIHILNHRGDIRKVLWPTVIAVLTTCAGFSAFLLDPAPLLRDFGLLAIVGLVGGLFWALILFYPDHGSLRADLPFKNKIHFIEKLWNSSSLFVGIILFAFLIPGVFRIKSEINILSTLPGGHRTVQDYLFIEKNVGPYVPVEYCVDISQTNSQDLSNWIEAVYSLDKVGAVMSYLAIPVWMDQRNFGYVSEDGRTGRVVFFVPVISTTEGMQLVHQIENLAKEYFPDSRVIPKPTGYVSLYVSVANHLAKSFRQSLLLAFVFVFLLILIYLRNLKLFLASVLPNLFPVIAILGVMGWFHIPLDMITVPMGCMALGIIVDDTVHFLYWYRKTDSVHLALKNAGPGSVITSLIYILGFSVFLFSEANPVRYFGILSITTMATALFGDIVILPVILMKIGRKNEKPERKQSE
jgi:predicted RND superfamily exporter protein